MAKKKIQVEKFLRIETVWRKQQQRTHLLSTKTNGLQDGFTVGSKPSPQNPAPQNMGILDFANMLA